MADGVDWLMREKTRKPGKKPLPARDVQRAHERSHRRRKQPAICWRKRPG